MFEESSRMASERQHSNAWEDPKAQVRKKGGALGFMYEAPPGYIPDDETPAPKRIVAEKEDDDDAESVAAGAAQGGGGAGGQGGPDPRSIQPLGIQVSSEPSRFTTLLWLVSEAYVAPRVHRMVCWFVAWFRAARYCQAVFDAHASSRGTGGCC